MIKDILLENVSLSEGEFEKNIVAKNISGKILKILFEPTNGVRFKLFTKEGEEILDVKTKGVYYPRANISQQKMDKSAIDSSDKTDYFYFTEGLLLNFSVENMNFAGLIIKKVIITYAS